MMTAYDIAYALCGGLSAPVWLLIPAARRKVAEAMANRMGNLAARKGDGPAVIIHAVSVGEINATRDLVRRLRDKGPAGLHVIVSTTTQTGFARGLEMYGNAADVTLVRFPLDFSWAIDRVLTNLRPSAVVLMELEVWPNFLRRCRRRGVPVVVINGRLTTASFRRYRWIKPLGLFKQLTRICAQDEAYAERFVALGAPADRVSVTGTMKFDTADAKVDMTAASAMAASVGLTPGGDLVWVCGSTGPGEEPIVLECYRDLLKRFPRLRLVIVPRRPDRFDEVAGLIESAAFVCQRRSAPKPPHSAAVILGDTMGELRLWYALSDVVFVGRTLVDLGPRQHGSDMIEPAALGKPVVIGPFTGNFAEPMTHFVAAGAMRVVHDGAELARAITDLLGDSAEAAAMGRRAGTVVIEQKGATDRHVKVILDLI